MAVNLEASSRTAASRDGRAKPAVQFSATPHADVTDLRHVHVGKLHTSVKHECYTCNEHMADSSCCSCRAHAQEPLQQRHHLAAGEPAQVSLCRCGFPETEYTVACGWLSRLHAAGQGGPAGVRCRSQLPQGRQLRWRVRYVWQRILRQRLCPTQSSNLQHTQQTVIRAATNSTQHSVIST